MGNRMLNRTTIAQTASTLFVISFVTVATSSCGIKSSVEPVKENQTTNVDPTAGSAALTPATPFPAGFPVSQYPESKVSISSETPSWVKNANVITLTTNDSQDKVANFYRNELTAKGWKINYDKTTPPNPKRQLPGYICLTAVQGADQLTTTIQNGSANDTSVQLMFNHVDKPQPRKK